MDLFMPSKKVLETLGWDDSSYRRYNIFPPETSNESELVSYVNGLATEVSMAYQLIFNIEEDNQRINEIYNNFILTAFEALKNACVHGSKGRHPFIHGVFLGREGICSGFQDQGGFFKRPDVKHRFENKIPLKEFNLEHDGLMAGARAGVSKNIFPCSDLMEVDKDRGILYCVHLRK